MTSLYPPATWTQRCRYRGAWLSPVLLLSGCFSIGISEMLTPYDFQTDPDGDATLATARPLNWVGDTAVGVGGISFDQASLLALRSFIQGEEIVGYFDPPLGERDIFSLGQLDTGDEIGLTHSSLTETILLATRIGQADFVKNAASTVFILVNGAREIVGYPGAAPVVIRSEGEHFIVVSPPRSVPFDYTFAVTRQPNRETAPRRGVLLLSFDGAVDLDITFTGDYIETAGELVVVTELPAFDLEEVRPDFPGQTERFKQLVRRRVEYIYADYDVLVTTDPEEAKAAGHHDTVVFTSATGRDLGMEREPAGVEPAIDVEDRIEQVGIIFIRATNAGNAPTDFNAFCATWGHVAAHEYGHAIGLFHVEQLSEALMSPYYCDYAGGCKRQLEGLTKAPLLDDSLPLIQDPDTYLARIFGRRDPAQAAAIRARGPGPLPE